MLPSFWQFLENMNIKKAKSTFPLVILSLFYTFLFLLSNADLTDSFSILHSDRYDAGGSRQPSCTGFFFYNFYFAKRAFLGKKNCRALFCVTLFHVILLAIIFDLNSLFLRNPNWQLACGVWLCNFIWQFYFPGIFPLSYVVRRQWHTCMLESVSGDLLSCSYFWKFSVVFSNAFCLFSF